MTTTVDFDALQAARGPRVTILMNQDVDRAGAGGAFADFSGFESVYLEVAVIRRRDPVGAGTLTLTIEHSDDGESWTTAHEFDFVGDGKQAFVLSAPKAHVRASWAVVSSEWRIQQVVAAPTTIDAPGGSLPAGGTTGQVLTKESDDDGDADWEDAGGGSQPVQVSTATLTASELIAFDFGDPATWIQVVPPQIGSTFFVIERAVAHFRAGATPYNENAIQVELFNNDASPCASVAMDFSAAVDQYADMVLQSGSFPPTLAQLQDPYYGAPASSVSGGDGTLTITVWYVVVDASDLT